ncbi:MAG: ABC transporter substrate-binding protein [Burkholderiaceae bacterium]|nr:ABC transporter substrate-binding protein [Burkholderiaceae bacterium]
MHRRTFLAAGALGLGATIQPVRASALSNAKAKQVYSGSTILIGQSAVQSGPSALLGTEMTAGMKAAFALANKSGGVNGRKIELVSLDDQYEPQPCKENTLKLIEQGVFALGGYVGTPTCLAAFPVIVEAGIPFVGAFTGAESLRKFEPNIFHTRASYNRECQVLVKQLLAYSDSAQVAIFAQDDSYGEAITQGVTQALAERGKQPVVVSKVARNSLNVAQAAKEIAASGATAVALGNVYGPCAKLVETLGPQEKTMMYCGVSFIGTSGLINNLRAKAKGIGITQVMPYPWKESPPLVVEFRKAMALTDAEVSYGALEGYVNAQVILRGIAQCGDTLTWQRFVDALERKHDLGGFTLEFSASSHNGSKYVDVTVINSAGRVQV